MSWVLPRGSVSAPSPVTRAAITGNSLQEPQIRPDPWSQTDVTTRVSEAQDQVPIDSCR